MQTPNIGGATPFNVLPCPLDFGCTRLFEWVHLLNAARNGIPKPKFFGNCNPCLFVTFCGLKTFQPANRRQRDQIVTKMWSHRRWSASGDQGVNLLMPKLHVHRLTDYFLANTDTAYLAKYQCCRIGYLAELHWENTIWHREQKLCCFFGIRSAKDVDGCSSALSRVSSH